MTNHADVPNYPENAADNLIRIMNALVAAKADAETYERLAAAADLVRRLTIEQDAAVAAAAIVTAAQAKAATAARFSTMRDIRVTDAKPDEHVLGTAFEITYTQVAWNGYVSAPQATTVAGFGLLPRLVLDYLIEQHPARIPVKITRLAADPYDAFDRYFVGMKRGSLSASAYDFQGARA